jgi:hypothetical protein
MQIESAKKLNVYTLAYELAMTIFEISKTFPCYPEEALDYFLSVPMDLLATRHFLHPLGTRLELRAEP